MARKSTEAAHRRAMSIWHLVIPAAAVVIAALVGIVLPVPYTRGSFLVTVSEGGEPGRPFAVVLLLASRRGVGAIERWLAEGQRTGNFPGLATIPGTSVLDVHPLIHD